MRLGGTGRSFPGSGSWPRPTAICGKKSGKDDSAKTCCTASPCPPTIPPLRERKQDIPGLVQAFIEHFARRHDKHPLPLSPEQQRRLCEYDWPGNVRERQK